MSTALSSRAVQGVSWVGVFVVTAYASLVAWAAGALPYETWAALLFVPLVLLANVPLLVRAGRRDPDPRFLKLLVLAFVAKAVATLGRYLMGFVLYHGVADAMGYDNNGSRLAGFYRDFVFGADIGRPLVGTGFIRVVTGAIYTVTGQSIFVAYTIFSVLGFWGLYFFYRAFRVAFPDGNARRYALLVFFLPSMLFWPSSLGKEAWMTLGLGLIAYGSALLLAGDRRCLIPLVAGLFETGMVRPHITAAVFAGLAVAYLLGRNHRPATELTPLARGLAIVVLAGGGLVVVGNAAGFLGISDVSVAGVNKAIDSTGERTSNGGSSFRSEPVTSPLDFPRAAVTVLFRPFLFEARNAQMLLAAAEGSFLMVLILRFWREVRASVGRLRRQPYLLMCLAYSAVFVYAFSSFSNFGILTRERVQVLPFVLVFLSLPIVRQTRPQRANDANRPGVSV